MVTVITDDEAIVNMMCNMPGAFAIFSKTCANAREYGMAMVHLEVSGPLTMSLIAMHKDEDDSMAFLLVQAPQEYKRELEERLLVIVQDESGGEWEQLEDEDYLN